jgi:hypothetical protein
VGVSEVFNVKDGEEGRVNMMIRQINKSNRKVVRAKERG